MIFLLRYFRGKALKYTEYEDDQLFSIIDPVCRGLNTKIVRLSSAIVKSTLQVYLVLHKKGGISIDQCTKVSKAVLPRIEVLSDVRDVALEVSSPGAGRILKDAYEFKAFLEEPVSLLINGSWCKGIITYSDDRKIKLKTIDGPESEYSLDSIQKAKLD